MADNGAKTTQPLQEITNLNQNNNSKPKKSIEETYQKRTQHHHSLLRPDTYIGSIVKNKQKLWVFEEDKMVDRNIEYVPGLYKIFDEILVNAADNKQRDPSMNRVEVEIRPKDNFISVFNNGEGIPVAMHGVEKVYVPEMIFGQLLTSSNYDDKAKKTTGGRNGFGAKLTNIFSTEFVVETADGKRKKKYRQVFSNNMTHRSPPSITACDSAESWTKISFKPDLAKFKMDHLEADVVALMKKRVVDLAGCLGETVAVVLNGKRVPVRSFPDYVNLYLESRFGDKKDTIPRFERKCNDRWEVCICVTEGNFEQVSFVNAIATMKGGTHVDDVTDQVVDYAIEKVLQANPSADVRPHIVKNSLWVFINAMIDNLSFNSQTKMTLTTRPDNFGSYCNLPKEFLEKVCNAGVLENVISWVDHKKKKEQKKADKDKRQRLTGIPKLEDANEAGSDRAKDCTLILTEGDSAKALAMAGVAAVGRDCYGVFPLRGKPLNTRDANQIQISYNAEIQNITKILGLELGKKYDGVESLRYGHLMIMTDQDHDGSHIKGLLINLFHSLWPSLLKIPSFLLEFITPIVKVTSLLSGQILSFYSMPEYESWKRSLGGNTAGWSIKYYKGLGTSTSKEGKEYFQDLDKHRKFFVMVDKDDEEAIQLAFSKDKIEDRKKWLLKFEPGTHLDQKETYIKYSDFINKEFIQFSVVDNQRSIPSMVDGFKPGQRKILYCCFKRNFIKEAKVAQFSGYVSEHSAYHHGEQSLASTIVGMAQDYVGSNNINLLQPNGQFGTRHQGGKDHASARYIYTCLSPITRFLFNRNDDPLLNYLNEDGQSVEPTWYVPIIPMVLVNGTEGIGTGWSTRIPNYNPRDIVTNVRHFLNEEAMEPMVPWYKGFKGTIERTEGDGSGTSFTISGIIEEVNKTKVRITELPIRKSTEEYKQFLDTLCTKSRKNKEQFIKDFKERNDDKTVDFEVSLSEKSLSEAKKEGLLTKFKLTTTISTGNMHLFDPKGILKKYSTPEEIIQEFCELRLELYEKRKTHLLEKLELQLLQLENKVRFIQEIVSGKINVMNRKRADLLLELKQKNFTPFCMDAKAAGRDQQTDNSGDYGYLLSMPIGILTMEKLEELCGQRKKLDDEVNELRNSTAKSLWFKDLEVLERELNLESDLYARPKDKIKEDLADGCKKPKRTRKKSSKKEAVNVEPVAEEGSAPSEDKTAEASEPMESQGVPSRVEAPIENQPPYISSDPSKEKPAALEEINLGQGGIQEQIQEIIQNSSADKSTETKTSLPKAPAEDNASRDNSKDCIIEISDTEIDCENDKEQNDIIDQIPDKEDDVQLQIIRTNGVGDKQLEAQVASAVDRAMNGSSVANRTSTGKESIKHVMMTRKRAKEIQQMQETTVDRGFLKAIENIVAISPEKKVRKTSHVPFRKKKGSHASSEINGEDKENSNCCG